MFFVALNYIFNNDDDDDDGRDDDAVMVTDVALFSNINIIILGMNHDAVCRVKPH